MDGIEIVEEDSLFDWVLIRLVVKPTKDDFGTPVDKKYIFQT